MNGMHDLAYHGPVVILDLDDTLYPEVDFVRSGYQAVAESLFRRDGINPDETLRVMMDAFKSGNNPFDSLLEAFPGISYPDSLIPMCVSIYRFHTPKLELPRSSLDFLLALQRRGIRMALVTDGRAVTQMAKIRALGIEEFFSPHDILISEEQGIGKTDIHPWRTIAGHYPEASRFFIIGDNPAKDFFYPNMLGFTTICLSDKGTNIHSQTSSPSEAHKPQIILDTIAEALPLIIPE